MRKEADLNLWKTLYETAAEIKKLKPWNEFWDTDLIVIELPGEEEPIFCSLMGQGGICTGISIYEGYEGLRDFDLVATSEKKHLPVDYVMMEQSNLSCFWGDREEVPPKQKALIKELGLKFRGRGQWLYFESYKKRCIPYILDEREVKLLIEVYKALLIAVKSVLKGRVKVNYEYGEFLWGRYNEEMKVWEFYTDELPSIPEYPMVQLEDEILRKRIQKRPKVPAELAFEFSYMNSAVTDKIYDRPMNPLLFLVFDVKKEMIVTIHMVEVDKSEIDVVLNFFIQFIEQYGCMRSIRARNPWVFSALEDICDYCDISLIRDNLLQVDEILWEMKREI